MYYLLSRYKGYFCVVVADVNERVNGEVGGAREGEKFGLVS